MTADAQLSLVFTGTKAEKFESFHRENPWVYRTLVRLAREYINRTGQSRIGIKSLYEVTRWQLQMETSDAQFRLDNTWTAFYARLIMAKERDLDGIFELRSSLADEWVGHYVAAGAA